LTWHNSTTGAGVCGASVTRAAPTSTGAVIEEAFLRMSLHCGFGATALKRGGTVLETASVARAVGGEANFVDGTRSLRGDPHMKGGAHIASAAKAAEERRGESAAVSLATSSP
jgi:hypothetical protein